MLIRFRRYDGPDLSRGPTPFAGGSFGVLMRAALESWPEVDARTILGMVAPGGTPPKRAGVELGINGLAEAVR